MLITCAFAVNAYKTDPQSRHQAHSSYGYPNPEVYSKSRNVRKKSTSPKLINKGDYYLDKTKKVELIRLRDQILVQGAEQEAEDSIREVLQAKGRDKGGKGEDLFAVKGLSDKNAFFYEFPVVGEEDLATELIKDLKQKPKVHYAHPVFLDKETGLRMALTDQILVKLKRGYKKDDLLAITPSYIQIKDGKLYEETGIYVLIVKDAKGRDILKISRDYAESEIIELSSPNFLMEMESYQDPPIDPNFEYPDTSFPYDPKYSEQWHLNNENNQAADVDAPEAWDITTGTPDIVVAILNSGVDTYHLDLQQNLWTNPNPGEPDIHGWDFYYNTPNVDPDLGPNSAHGTACAGVCAAVSNTLGGLGIAPDVTILPVKIMNEDNEGYPAWLDQISFGILYAAERADILSCSWTMPPNPFIEAAINIAVTGRNANGDEVETKRGDKGCLVFFATGNMADGFNTFDLAKELDKEKPISEGWHTYAWVYRKDINPDFGVEDKVWIDRIEFPGDYTENFDDIPLPMGWRSASYSNYFPFPLTPYQMLWLTVDDARHYYKGSDVKSIQSGAIGDMEHCVLEYHGYNSEPGNIIFRYWTSTVTNGDYLQFWIDGHCYFTASGESTSEYHNHWEVDPNIAHYARFPNTIAVGSCTNHNFRSHYSCYGPELDFLAPSDGGTKGIYTTIPVAYGSFTDRFGGTSSACPLAAGIAALILSLDHDMHWETVRQRLRDSCDKIGPSSYGSDGWNKYYGYGKVNAFKALTFLYPPADVQASDGTYCDRIEITWGDIDWANGYDVYRSTSETGAKSLIAESIAGTSYTDFTVTPESQYYYWVKSVSNYAESDFSSPDSGWCVPLNGAYMENDGIVVMEAEHYYSTEQREDDDTWYAATTISGYVDDAYMIPGPDDNSVCYGYSEGAIVSYKVRISNPGTYYLRVRMYALNGSSNSCWIGIESGQIGTYHWNTPPTYYNQWNWAGYLTGDIGFYLSAGLHTINMVKREDGTIIDRIALALNTSDLPSGSIVGPTESPTEVGGFSEDFEDGDIDSWITGGHAVWSATTDAAYEGSYSAGSGDIVDNQESYIKMTVESSGILTFWWKVSSEYYWDYLRFYINGVQQDRISGNVNWSQKVYSISSGDEIMWRYTKDGSVSRYSDKGWIDNIQIIEGEPSVNFSEDFEDGDIDSWITGGHAVWFATTDAAYEGSYSAGSGDIADYQESYIKMTVESSGILTFWWKVSSEYYWDYLRFYINGVEQNKISGNIDWTKQSYSVTSGDEVMWKYTKDCSVSRYSDKGWIDDINIESY